MNKKPDILYEDNHILILNKPPGILSQSDETGDITILDIAKEYIKNKYKKPGNVFLHPVHRLDRPTSGILMMARTSKAQTRLASLFKQRMIQKQYIALTHFDPAVRKDQLVHFLKKNKSKNKSFTYEDEVEGSKKSVLQYEVLGRISDISILKIELYTGRSHQIRVQLSSIGCPLLGDIKYGEKQVLPDRSIALHAYRIRFIHPVRHVPVEVTAPFPKTSHWKIIQQIDAPF